MTTPHTKAPEGAGYPDDVMRDAAQICRDTDYSPTNFDGTPSTVCKAIARAIMAERRRCWNIAADCELELVEYPSEQAAEHYRGGSLDTSLSIAAAIRGER